MNQSAAEAIGEAIKRTRKDFQLTQQQLADLAGISDKTLRDIERGTGSPSIGAVIRVAHAIGLQITISSEVN